MSFLLTAAGWLLALACTEVTVSHAVRAAVPRWRLSVRGYWPPALLYGAVSAVAFTVLGVLPALQGILLAALLAGVDAWYLLEPWVAAAARGKGHLVRRRVMAGAAGQVKAGPRCLLSDFRALLSRRAAAGPQPRRGPQVAAQAPAGPARTPPPPPAPAPARGVPAPRDVPSVRDDPALGTAPAPADVAGDLVLTGVVVPAAWAALCDAVASFEPESDEELLEHVAGEAAGILAFAEAVRARAETLLHGTGLDPAYVAGHHELADEIADLASAVSLVDRRFHAIYGTLRQWVAGGGILPHNARQWLAGGDAASQDAGDDDVAA
jgi:hypothetical protein